MPFKEFPIFQIQSFLLPLPRFQPCPPLPQKSSRESQEGLKSQTQFKESNLNIRFQFSFLFLFSFLSIRNQIPINHLPSFVSQFFFQTQIKLPTVYKPNQLFKVYPILFFFFLFSESPFPEPVFSNCSRLAIL